MNEKTKFKAKKGAVKKVAPKRYFGTTKVKTGAKVALVSSQNKNGWSLGIALGKRNVWLTGVRFASVEEVQRAVKSDIVFLAAANAKK